MIKLNCYNNKRFALFGLGDSGVAAAKALQAGGAYVVCWDDNELSRLKAAKANVPLCHLKEIDWSSIEALILAPGVPLNYPVPHWSVQLAQEHKVPIIGDLELFAVQRSYYLFQYGLKHADIPVIAITGTNGKSTTTNLIVHLLRIMGKDAEMGGNIGRAALDLPPFQKDRFYVIECSSFQLELAPSLCPDIGILLNITPDHIERHGSFANYESIKKSLIKRSRIGFVPQELADIAGSALHKIGAQHDYHAIDAQLFYKSHKLADLSNAKALLGPHNAQNALNAIGAIRELLGEDAPWQEACETYVSLPHRMQHVRTIGTISFINDSKATNAEASMQALQSFSNIYWIIGGVAKQDGIKILKPLFHKITNAYLIGEAAQNFAKYIDTSFNFFNCGTLEKAVTQAFYDAKKDARDSVILLSPACASYDQFANYGARGDAFINIVNNLEDNS